MAKTGKPLRDDCIDDIATIAHAVDPSAIRKEDLGVVLRDTLKEIGRPKKFWQYGIEYQINALLSGLGTPLANIASVAYKQVMNPILDSIESLNPKSKKSFSDVASAVDQALQGFFADAVYFKAGWVQGYPLDIVTSVRDAAKKMGVGEAKARQDLVKAMQEYRARLITERDPNIKYEDALETVKRNYKPTDENINEYLRETYDYVRGTIPGKTGEVIRWPTKLSVAIDEYGKARFRRYKIGMMASQQARLDASKGKGDYKELRDQYIRQSMEHITVDDKNGQLKDALLAEAIKKNFGQLQKDVDKTFVSQAAPYETVKEYALREMFQQKLTGLAKDAADYRNKNPIVSLFVPFLKTPWNIVKEGTSYVPVIPQVLKKYLPANPEKDMPGAFYEFTNEEMMARQVMAAGAFAFGLGMVQNGEMTGRPRDAQEAQAWKDAGIPQMSIRIGDTWVSYERIEPLASVFGMISEMGRAWDEVSSLPEVDDKWEVWAEEFGKGAMFSIKTNILQKSFFDGYYNMFSSVFNENNSALGGGVTGIARQFTPAFLNQIARISDPYERQATTLQEKLMQRVPGLRQQLPEEYGLIGEPRRRNLLQAITSFNVQSAEQTPLEKYIGDLGLTKVREDKMLKSVELDNEQLANLRKMTSQFITPRLERYVASPAFQRLPDARKKVELEKRIDKLKRVPRTRFYNELRRTNPEMAEKFKIEVLRKQGRLE